eukprot:2698718-Prymnesium_polylepis.1
MPGTGARQGGGAARAAAHTVPSTRDTHTEGIWLGPGSPGAMNLTIKPSAPASARPRGCGAVSWGA